MLIIIDSIVVGLYIYIYIYSISGKNKVATNICHQNIIFGSNKCLPPNDIISGDKYLPPKTKLWWQKFVATKNLSPLNSPLYDNYFTVLYIY